MLLSISEVKDVLYASMHPTSATPFFIKMCFVISVGSMGSIFAIIAYIPLIKFAEEQYNRKIAFARNHINKLLLSAVMSQAKVREADLPKSNLTIGAFNKSNISSGTVKRLLVCEMFNYRNIFWEKLQTISGGYTLSSRCKKTLSESYIAGSGK